MIITLNTHFFYAHCQSTALDLHFLRGTAIRPGLSRLGCFLGEIRVTRSGTANNPAGQMDSTHSPRLGMNYDIDQGIIEWKLKAGVGYHCSSVGPRRTRSEHTYVLISTHYDGRIPTGMPYTVSGPGNNIVRLLSHGSKMTEGPTQPDNFFASLKTWKGEWMWNNIVNEVYDLQLVVYTLTLGTAIWVTNGSFNWATAPLVSGAGWILYCMSSKKRLNKMP